MASTAPARGMRDFLPPDVRRRTYVIGVIRQVYERYGFEPLETPAVENIETLLGKYGEEGNQLIFKILMRGEHEATGKADLALRYDLTVPLSRVVAEHRGTLPKYFKRYQIQPVWRADRPARGRFREFYQCDVDVTGSTSPVVEAELCAAACEAMQTLGFRDFTLRVNHRHLLTAILEHHGIPPERHVEALTAIDKLDKIGSAGVAEEFVRRGITLDETTGSLFWVFGGDALGDEPLAALKSYLRLPPMSLERAHAAISNLQQVIDLTRNTPAAGHVRVDLSLARGLSYYTGCIMEMTVPDLAGSLGGGGRYDGLVGMFLGQPVPAAGFSLGLERILVVMTERDMFPAHVAATAADVLVAQWNADAAGEALALAHDLRRAGLRVEVYPDADKLGKQFKYAASTGVPLVVIEGDDEKAAGEITVKDLRTGEQQRLSRADAASRLQALLVNTDH